MNKNPRDKPRGIFISDIISPARETRATAT